MTFDNNNHNNNNGDALPATDKVPVTIIGAGPVGLLLALLLARKNIRSMVLEQSDDIDVSPRAVVHYPTVLDVFKKAGIYEHVADHGMRLWGACWRGALVDDGKGNKLLGPVIAEFAMRPNNADGAKPEGGFVSAFAQGYLTALMLEEVRKTGLVEVVFKANFTGFQEGSADIEIAFATPAGSQSLRSEYLVGCDGARSSVRKAASITFSGHSWPERLLAVDLEREVEVLEDLPAYYKVDRRYWGVIVPLRKVVAGEPGLWRFAMAIPDQSLTDEEVVDDQFVEELLSHYIDGPRPSKHKVLRKRAYRTQQLLASTMNRGRVLLAGDAAHLNNPIGGLGLATGLLDVDILHEALNLILNHGYHDPQNLLAEYSAARRSVFANLINPTTTANKLRLQESEPEDAAREDWYFRALRRKDPQEIGNMGKSFMQAWTTDINTLTKNVQPAK